MLEHMRNSTFCYSPLGSHGADSDRWLPAIMTGCIPIILNSVQYGSRIDTIHYPEGVDHTVAITVNTHTVQFLDEILAQTSEHEIMMKRAHMAVLWRRLLWTSIYDSEIGETTEHDALTQLIKKLVP
jgi:hypothetical protein